LIVTWRNLFFHKKFAVNYLFLDPKNASRSKQCTNIQNAHGKSYTVSTRIVKVSCEELIVT
jgi:hypothetical protein